MNLRVIGMILALSAAPAALTAQEVDAEQLMDMELIADAQCRGYPAQPETRFWCDVEKGLNGILNVRGWCYGREQDDATYLYRWHRCGPDSYRDYDSLGRRR